MPVTLRVTDAERWELLARREAVETARLRLAIAEAQAHEAANRILANYGVTGACDIAADGTIQRRDPLPTPTAGAHPTAGVEEAMCS